MPTELRRRRLERGLGQVHVAKLVGVSQPTIVNWEQGHSFPRDPEVHRALRKLFGVPVSVLLAPEPGTTDAAQKGGAVQR